MFSSCKLFDQNLYYLLIYFIKVQLKYNIIFISVALYSDLTFTYLMM